MPKSATNFRIRLLRKEEIPKVLDLCKSEGRHMGRQPELESWFEFDPFGFFIAVTDTGEVLGSCAGVRLSDFHGNVGMYVVKQEFRGTGIGKQLWNEAIAHLGERNKGLSAVAALFPVYRDKAGFSQIADWSVDLYKLNDASNLCTQFRLDCRNSAPFLLLNSQSRRIANSTQTSEMKSDAWNASSTMSVKITKDLVAALIAYDFGLHLYDRSNIVELTVNERDCRSRVALRGDTVLGYGCIKPNLQGLWMIAPLYAENALVARRLLYDLINSLSPSEQKRGVVLKSPSNNESVVSLLKTFGFQRQTYSLKRCYTEYVLNVPTNHIYAFHSTVFCSE